MQKSVNSKSMEISKRTRTRMIENVVDHQEETTVELPEDELDLVFRFLDTTSLARSAQVCTLWNRVAQRAMSKFGPYNVVIEPYYFEHEQVIDHFKVKPKVSLLFCASRPHLRNADNIEYAMLYMYNANFPLMGHRIMLGVEHSMIDNREIKSCDERNTVAEHFDSNGVLGLILPDTKDFIVKFAWSESNEEFSAKYARNILNQLQPDEQAGKPVYLIFGRENFTISAQLLNLLQEKYPDSHPSVWGSTIRYFIKCNDSYPTEEDAMSHYKEVHEQYSSVHGCLAILLQRQGLSQYSTVISIDDDFDEKIKKFKARVTVKRRSMGLVCGPHSRNNVYIYTSIMSILKNHFPTITFTGYFDAPKHSYYGCDNTSTGGNAKLIYENAISIMILTYY